MKRIVNVSNAPFEFTFNSCVYGPYAPGQVVELPYAIAEHGVKRGMIVDDMGNFVGNRCEFLDDLQNDQERMKSILMYECPLAVSHQCAAASFRNLDELRAHMETHWTTAADPLAPVEQAMAGSSKKR
jgi:hypothetical protein